ncbi:hypothetical protein [Actinoplanes teichomyceticus]|uniref:Uncharacterized protein n=1 Tax=Actinoplanes teichomyceticus TaxID=1867 RepID=A0A561WB72_ACTTI|nr:hypothetical protein [Actinoplanes teichomyceticus]TWG21099.1 hypothetical protein FHX34_103629 [Actinoplanes teichomyceticus]GIF14918.1 hypothetical protein Ate01nite_49500 [Actinoplanes teichomyceticus]
MTTIPTNEPAATTGWQRFAAFCRRLVAALRGPDPIPYVPPPPPPPPGRLTERRTIAPLAVPARGLAFHFQVYGMFLWTTDGLERSALHALVERFLPYAHQYLKELATDLAGEVEPHRGGDFERRLRQRLDRLGEWTYQRRGQEVTCRPQVRVHLDERVQQHIRPYWEQLIALDYERDLAARRARNMAGASTQWASILERLIDGPVPGGAATMTDEQLAQVVKELLVDRAAKVDPLLEALNSLKPQDEYAREGYFDLLDSVRPPQPPA